LYVETTQVEDISWPSLKFIIITHPPYRGSDTYNVYIHVHTHTHTYTQEHTYIHQHTTPAHTHTHTSTHTHKHILPPVKQIYT